MYLNEIKEERIYLYQPANSKDEIFNYKYDISMDKYCV